MAAIIVATIAAGTLAFGSVYPWGYLPLFAIAAGIGAVGLAKHRVPADRRALAVALAAVATAIALQLVPLPRTMAERVSPHTVDWLLNYRLGLASASNDAMPLSINPEATAIGLLAFAALALYLIGAPGLLNDNTLRSLPQYLALFVIPLALFGIYTRDHNNGLIYWFWHPYDGTGSGQFGPFINRNHFAGWMLMVVCILIGWLLGQVERVLAAPPGRGVLSHAAGVMGLAVLAILVGILSLMWTMSRSGQIACGAAMLLFAYLVTRRHRFRLQKPALVLGLAVLLLVPMLWRGLDSMAAWFANTHDVWTRLDAWRDGWLVVRDFPLFGTGVNTYPTAMLFYQRHGLELYVAQAHNDYLQLLAEGGLLVAIPAAVAAFLLARAIGRNIRRVSVESRGYWIRAGAAVGLAAIALQEVAEFSLQIPVNALLFCTLAAIALAPARPASSNLRAKIAPGRSPVHG